MFRHFRGACFAEGDGLCGADFRAFAARLIITEDLAVLVVDSGLRDAELLFFCKRNGTDGARRADLRTAVAVETAMAVCEIDSDKAVA